LLGWAFLTSTQQSKSINTLKFLDSGFAVFGFLWYNYKKRIFFKKLL